MKLLKRLGQYLREVRMELKRVQWPSRREFVVYTGMVIFAVVVFGLLFWGRIPQLLRFAFSYQ